MKQDRMKLKWKARRLFSNEVESPPCVVTEHDEWVATVPGSPHLGFEDSLPIAKLIAAAPEMLAELEGIVNVYHEWMADQTSQKDRIMYYANPEGKRFAGVKVTVAQVVRIIEIISKAKS